MRWLLGRPLTITSRTFSVKVGLLVRIRALASAAGSSENRRPLASEAKGIMIDPRASSRYDRGVGPA